MLYWYSLQNLGMGTYTLHATGSGGLVLGGAAIYFIVIPKHKRIVVITNPDVREAMLAQYSDYLNALARLQGVTPDPNPPSGTITIPVLPASQTLSALLDNSLGRLDQLNQMVPQPNPSGGVVVVQTGTPTETLSKSLSRAAKLLADLEAREAMLVIKGNQ